MPFFTLLARKVYNLFTFLIPIYKKVGCLENAGLGILTNQMVVSSTFSKVALHAEWRGSVRELGVRTNPPVVLTHFFKSGRPRGVSAKNGISFWELFLCASCGKEKVDKRVCYR